MGAGEKSEVGAAVVPAVFRNTNPTSPVVIEELRAGKCVLYILYFLLCVRIGFVGISR